MKSNFFYKIFRPLFVTYIKLLYNPITIGKENIPSGGFILVANHKNNLDFISMGLVTKRSIHFLAKSSLFKKPFGLLLNACGIIPVNRSVKDKTLIPKCISYISNDEIIGLFPEGTFNKTKNIILPFKIGAIKIAYETSKPIVPISIGKYRRKMKIIIGTPFYVSGNDLDYENYRLMNVMKKLIKLNGE